MSTHYPTIDQVDFSTRVVNALTALGIRDIRQLATMTEHDLLRSPNLGRKSVSEIRNVLSNHGLALGMVVVDLPATPAPTQTSSARSTSWWIHRSLQRVAVLYHEWAMQGCPSAHNLLGYMYHLGLGVARDHGRALEHYRSAARMGNHLAIFNLGLLVSNWEGEMSFAGPVVPDDSAN